MENNNRDKASDASPEKDWQNAQGNNNTRNTEDQRLYATERDKKEDDDDNDDDDEKTGDWGHVDPAESNSPFPDSNDPTAPGSAV